MEERTKAADDYATTFSTNNLCKQLMYPQKKTRRCLIADAKQSPLQGICPQSQGDTLKGVFSMIFIRNHCQRRQHKHLRCASCSKRARTCFGRRTGGIHVVNQQNWGRNARRWRRTRRAGSSGAGGVQPLLGCGFARADQQRLAGQIAPLRKGLCQQPTVVNAARVKVLLRHRDGGDNRVRAAGQRDTRMPCRPPVPARIRRCRCI